MRPLRLSKKKQQTGLNKIVQPLVLADFVLPLCNRLRSLQHDHGQTIFVSLPMLLGRPIASHMMIGSRNVIGHRCRRRSIDSA